MVAQQQASQRGHVGADATHEALLLSRIGHANFDRAIQSQLAIANLFEQLGRTLEHEVGAQHPVTIAAACAFDLTSGRDFLLAGQQRDLSHLHQVHANWVVGTGDLFFQVFQVAFFNQVGIQFVADIANQFIVQFTANNFGFFKMYFSHVH